MLEIEYLEKLVTHLATLYDQGLDCLDFDGNFVSDPEYDAYVRELKNRFPESTVFDSKFTSPSTYDPTGDLIVHNPPMTSIAKADGKDKENIYKKWIADCCSELNYKTPEGKFSQSFKRDGVAVRIYYKDGNLVSAGLRPRNGVNGINVTENIKYVNGVPLKLPQPFTLTITGELECHLSDFQKVQNNLIAFGEEVRKNPRNHTFGAINQQKDPEKTKSGLLSFTAHSIVNFDKASDYYTTEIERAKWCNKVLKIPYTRTEIHKFEDLSKLESMINTLDYEVDGIVLKVNNLEDQEQLGNSGDVPTGDPRGALAWKFAEEHKQAVVKKIIWKTTRTGRVPPVAIFEQGISLAGTIVVKATCCNYGWLERMCIGVGTVVDVYKAGKIIPKIDHVVSNPVNQIVHPTNCSICSSVLEIVKNADNKELMCLNENCASRNIIGISFYLQSIGAKGLGESKIEQFVLSGKAKNIADLYNLSLDDLQESDFTLREALLALATIHFVKPEENNDKLFNKISKAMQTKKKVLAWQFFGALGIPTAGKTAGKLLIDHFGNFEKIREASIDDLVAIDGIGEKTATIIHNWFKNNNDLINQLLNHIELELPKVGKLSDYTFVLSGSFDLGKSYWEDLIQEQGGKISNSVGSKTSYLVAGPKAGSKLEKAKDKGVPVISVEELKDFLFPKSNHNVS